MPILAEMKRLLLTYILSCLFISPVVAAYTDHRGHNVDSLERVVAAWPHERVEKASQAESEALVKAYYDLFNGYRNINGERSILFSRKCYALAKRWNWLAMMSDATRNIGIIHYGAERYDSALFYLNQALEIVDRMGAGERSFTGNMPYGEETVDDSYSSLYGALGNLYNMMDSIPRAMEYYEKAGAFFEKHGWNESLSLLWYNMGETWFEEGEVDKAGECYKTALKYGYESGDSLIVSEALKGMGEYSLAKGKMARALRYLQKADEYYSAHNEQEFISRIETLNFIGRVLEAQKRILTWFFAVSLALVAVLLLYLIILRRMYRLRKEKEGADAAIEQAMKEEEAPDTAGEEDLTEREIQILRLIAQGLTSPQIADKVYLSLPTIKWYRKRLLEKFDAANSAELISKAKERGLV